MTQNKLLKAIAFSAVTLSLFSCNNTKSYKITYHFTDDNVKTIKYKEGTSFDLMSPIDIQNYTFVSWYEDLNFESKAQSNYTASKDYDFYAFYQPNDKYYLTYNPNIEGYNEKYIREEYDIGGYATTSTCSYTREDYYFIGWNIAKDGTGTTIYPDQRIAINSNTTLYAIWHKEYTSPDSSFPYHIRIYENVIGKGSAVVIINGVEKEGFYDKETKEFTFLFGSDDQFDFNSDINGKIDEQTSTFSLRNDEEKGMYAFKSYLNGGTTDTSTILYLDGYRSGILGTMTEKGFKAQYYGNYSVLTPAESNQDKEYIFNIIDIETQKPTDEFFTFTFYKQNYNDNSINGTFTIRGKENGTYTRYKNGEYLKERLTLDGYGQATLESDYDEDTKTYRKKEVGTYKTTSNYNSLSGEYAFTPNGSKKTTLFCIYALEDDNGDSTFVYIVYDINSAGEFKLKDSDSDYPSLYLDGYMGCQYMINEDETLSGYYVFQDNKVIARFYNDQGVLISITSFNINVMTGTFTLDDTGFVIDETNTLLRYNGTSAIVEIPDTVIAIANDAFNYLYTNVNVTQVTIPSSVTKIGERAFQNNGTLKIVKVNSTTPAVIDKTSFRWPSGDFQIIVPNGYEDTYRNAEGWKEFASYITSEKEMENRPLFEIKDNILVRFNPKEDTDITNIVIPDEVKTIGEKVFRNVNDINSIDLNNVEVINKDAFLGCESLNTITADKVKSIGESAFLDCFKLNNVTLPNIETIGTNAFSACYALNNIIIGENIKSIGDRAFTQCSIEVKYDASTDEEILQNKLFFITFKGNVPPKMGVSIFEGTSVKIRLNNIDVALNFYNNGENWAYYFRHTFIDSKDEKGDYVDCNSLLLMHVDGRMEVADYFVYFYKIEGENVTLYYLDDGILYSSTGKYINSTFTIGDSKFVKEGTKLTYTSSNNDVLEIDTTIGRKELGQGYYYNAKFNGTNITLNATYSEIYANIGNLKYTFTLNTDNTFSYKTTIIPYTKTFTASDNSQITINFSEKSVVIKGTLNSIVTTSGTNLSTQTGWYATKVNDNTYTITTSYLSINYHVTFVIDGDNISYTYYSEQNINCRDTNGNIVIVTLDETNNIKRVVLNFKTSSGLVNAETNGVKENDYYVFNVNIKESVTDPNTGETTLVDSALNGVYHVSIDLNNKSCTITKVS